MKRQTKTDDDAIVDKSNTMKKEYVELGIFAVDLCTRVVMTNVNFIFFPHDIAKINSIFIFAKKFSLWDGRGLKIIRALFMNNERELVQPKSIAESKSTNVCTK